MANRAMQTSFVSGELSPSLAARIDLERYASGLALCRNAIVLPQGGVTNRPGTEFICNAHATGATIGPVWLIPFTFNSEQSYALLFQQDKFFIVKRESGTSGLVTLADIPVEVAHPYAEADIPFIKYDQSADVMYLACVGYAPMKITRTSHTAWTCEVIDFDEQQDRPTSVALAAYDTTGGFAYKYRVTAVFESGKESLSGLGDIANITTITAANPAVVTTDLAFRTGDITNINQTNPCLVDINVDPDTIDGYSNGARVWIDNVVGMTELNGKWYTIKKRNGGPGAWGWYLIGVDATGYTAYVSGGDTQLLGDVPNSGDEVFILGSTATDLNDRFFKVTKISLTEYELNGEDRSALAPETGGTMAVNFASISDVGELSSTNFIDISWVAPTTGVVSQYNVYRQLNGLYGYIGSTDAENTYFRDDNILPVLSETPKQPNNPFKTDFPGAVCFHEQRSVWGGSDGSPLGIFLSRIGVYDNFSHAIPRVPDDGFDYTITAGQERVRHLVSLDTLIVLTSGGEVVISPASAGDTLTPTSFKSKVQGHNGSSHVRPLVIGNAVIYLQRAGAQVIDLGYRYESDSYTGDDLTIMASHLLDGYTIDHWAYQKNPWSIIWCVRSDGALLSLTYNKAHEVWAWARHDTAGEFESVCCIPEGDEDGVYFIVKRTVNGSDYRYVERLHNRRLTGATGADGFFVDCGLTYSGAPATTFSGLDHLEGETVSILANGNVYTQQVVVSGDVTIPDACDLATIGLPITADVQTLRFMQKPGDPKKIGSVVVRCEKTRGIRIGPDFDNMTEVKFRTNEVWGAATQLKTGDIDPPVLIDPKWSRDGQICIRQTDPLPFTILGLFPEVAG